MKRVESLSNPRVKQVRNILRGRNKKSFLIEGKKLFQEAIASGIPFDQVFVTEALWKKERKWLSSLYLENEATLVTPRVMKAMSDLETPAGLLGVGQRSKSIAPKTPKTYAAFLFSIRDPGNMGTLIRTAEAAGCEFLACTNDCVDPFLPKVIRASMGSIFRTSIFEVQDSTGYLREVTNRGTTVYALIPRGGKEIFSINPLFPSLILIGSEGSGLPQNLPLHETISIPMNGKVESLNTAMAAGICFYYFSSRQAAGKVQVG